VLKGPAATAQYGSRAANGAIVITTKSGMKEKGIGVTINSSITWEKAGYYPDFQGVYGPGADGGCAPYAFWRWKNMSAPEGFPAKPNGSRMSYGEAFSADKLRSQYNSYNRETGEWTLTPFVYADDWFTGIMETGVTYRNNVTINTNNGKGTSARLSVTDTRNNWILPNTGYNNQTVSFAVTNKMNKWIKFSARANYLHKASDNLPVQGYSTQSPFYMLIWGNTNIHASDYRNEYFGGLCTEENFSGDRYDGKAMVQSMGNSTPVNPYRQLYEATNAINKDRVYGNVALDINLPVKGLTLNLRAGTDLSVDWRQQKKPFRSPGYMRGFYREQNNRDIETN
ncbi:MAG: SusC/RagA family TonB-linked outer membrane protein, partial [Muribaculaceae bacterium]|nr:SusC/RagA family TonB-linked outer membrane protein [Muribaculaceae bacterium]